MQTHKIIIEGDYALFARPEFVENVSYEVPTPSALMGILKSVYWKPAIRYVIDRIIVFNPIEYENVKRNEVKNKISVSKMKSKMQGRGGDPTLYTSENRAQRSSLLLRNVRYGVEFHFELTGLQGKISAEEAAKHVSMLQRRLENGQWFRAPYLGCSEFLIKRIDLVEEFDELQIDPSIRYARKKDLGMMLHHMHYYDNGKPLNEDWEHPQFSDKATGVFYHPYMECGIIDVAKYWEEARRDY